MREVTANPRPCCLGMTTEEWQRSYDLAVATLHDRHINDLKMGTADTKLIPLSINGELRWVVDVEDIVITKPLGWERVGENLNPLPFDTLTNMLALMPKWGD